MKRFYKNEVVVYWGLLIVSFLLIVLVSYNQGPVRSKAPKQQTINRVPVDELFLLHA